MSVQTLGIPGAHLLELPRGEDLRGSGIELFRQERFVCDLGRTFIGVQTSLLVNNNGTLRGLHLAEGLRQSKLITCIRGRIRDVLVDLRPTSQAFGKAITVDLCGDSPATVVCPPGVAHGFVSLEADSMVTLTVDVAFADVAEQTIDAFDPDLDIDWSISQDECVRSKRDRSAPRLWTLNLS